MAPIDLSNDLPSDLSSSLAGSLSSDSSVLAEDPQVPERIIAAPVAGRFALRTPEVVTSEGEIVSEGQIMGTIERNAGSVQVVSPHTGFLMGLLALPGEHVRAHQPLAWVRVLQDQ